MSIVWCCGFPAHGSLPWSFNEKLYCNRITVLPSLLFVISPLSFLISSSLPLCPHYPRFNWNELVYLSSSPSYSIPPSFHPCMLTYSRLLNKDRLEGQRLNKASLFLITFARFFSFSHLGTWKRWQLVDCGASNSSCLFDFIVLVENRSWKAKAHFLSLYTQNPIQLDLSSIFPPPCKSFILLQGPINPIHICSAFVAPWKMDLYVQ